MHSLVNNFDVTRNLAAVPFPYPRDLADEWIASTARALADGTAYQVAMAGREGKQRERWSASSDCVSTARAPRAVRLLGRAAVLGARRRHRGGGRLARWGMANLDLDWLDGLRRDRQSASIAVLRQIGFRQVGEGTREVRGARRGAAGAALRGDARRPVRRAGGRRQRREGEKPLLLVAACALIDADGRVLLARRPEGKKMAGLWEFPGGKLEPGRDSGGGADPRAEGGTRHRRGAQTAWRAFAFASMLMARSIC